MTVRALLILIATLAIAAPAEAAGTKITAASSQFGTMLWGPNRQAIYVFEKDGRNETNCRDECAKAWPPVYASGKPVAGERARSSLLAGSAAAAGARSPTAAARSTSTRTRARARSAATTSSSTAATGG